jgi:ankyrin repeat protein
MAEVAPDNVAYDEQPCSCIPEPLSTEPFPLHDRDSPLHKAAYKGDISTISSLVRSDDHIDARSFHDCTALHLAIRGNQADAVRILLSAGADPALEDTIDSAYYGPFDAINLAARVGSQHAMAALIDHGLGLPASTLSTAASLGYVDCMDTTVQKLGQNDFFKSSRLDGVRDALGKAALCWWVEAVECLLTRVEGFPDKQVKEDRDALGSALSCAVTSYDCDDRCRYPEV